MFVYMIENIQNNHFYVGKTKNSIHKRFKQHINDSNKGKEWCILHKAIRKYGKENFKIICLEEVDNEVLLNEREKYYIKTLSPIYNSAPGGQGGPLRTGVKLLEETKNKISRSKMGLKPSVETKEKMRKSKLGKKLSDKATENMIKKCAKTYHFEFEGKLLIITNLNKYCRENGLCRVNMRKVLKGKLKSHKGIRRTNP